VVQNARMKNTPTPTRVLVALLAAGTLFAGACSAGGSDAATTTTKAEKTSTTADKTTTTDDGTSTTEATDPGDGPSTEDLQAILPTAADLGTGWTEEAADTSGDSDSSALDEQCPDVAKLDGDSDDSDDSDHATVSFTDAKAERVAVELDPTATSRTEQELSDYVDALNACKATTTDNGLTTAFSFEVTPTDAYGDQGLKIETTINVTGAALPKPVKALLYTLVYRSGTVGVQIDGQDGIDDATAAVTAFDPDQLIKLADAIDPKISDLVGG